MFSRPLLYGYLDTLTPKVHSIAARPDICGWTMHGAAIREKPLSLVARSSLATLKNIVNVDHPRPQLLPWGS